MRFVGVSGRGAEGSRGLNLNSDQLHLYWKPHLKCKVVGEESPPTLLMPGDQRGEAMYHMVPIWLIVS